MYNNSLYFTIGISLFFAIYRFYPIVEFYVKDNVLEGEAPAIAERVKII